MAAMTQAGDDAAAGDWLPGARVRVRSTGEPGQVAFVGALRGKPGVFVGVRLDRRAGRNDGSVAGQRYFECEPGHGVFVRRENLAGQAGGHAGRPTSSRSVAGPHPGAVPGSAARSHEQTEAYMDNFHRGLEALGMHASEPGPAAEPGRSPFAVADLDMPFRPRAAGHAPPNLPRGPLNPEGRLFDASDLPLLCSALSPDGRECVVGGADHGLRVFELASAKEKRNLYTKKFGHREWVTGCSYCPDGTIVSAGMDNKLCHWRGSQCTDLEGHRGSVSQLIVGATGRLVLSASYDKTVRVWDLNSHRELACLKRQKAPILEMALSGGALLTGARDGVVVHWDLASCRPQPLDGAKHSGHVTALSCLDAGQFCSGDQAGNLRLWDLRDPGLGPMLSNIHPGGAVNAIAGAGDFQVVSAGADKRIVLSDLRRPGAALLDLQHHRDFIYSLCVASGYILSGGGDGMLLVHELATGRLNFGLGANTAGVRCIHATSAHIVAAGDDGKAMVYDFPATAA